MESLDDVLSRLDKLNSVGAALSKERDINRLLENILLAAKTITHADGGTLYRMCEDGRALRFEIMRTDSLGIAKGGTSGNPVDLPDVPLYLEDGKPNARTVAAYCALHQETVHIADAYAAEDFDFSGTRQFDAHTGYRSQSFLSVPMKDHEGDVIGVLQLINAQGQSDSGPTMVQAFSDSDQRLAESLASQAAIALTNRKLLGQLEVLFESFINLINSAIDEKSPYTAGHCQRVPTLTMMLAEAVNDTQQGPLADFTMTERDRYELKIAGLLHDCGKVTTPVHVVDKATKLHTLYDRIGLIDTRFEVLKRDCQIAALRAQLARRPASQTDAQLQEDAACANQLAADLAALDQDRDFLRSVNLGAEAMHAADIQRVSEIGRGRRWCDVDGEMSDFLTAEEIENLSIRAGTLNASERETINHHIVATNRMLEQLPWPKYLRNVPEYAGGHHERMDGKGYPKGLTRFQMSVQARVMGIADIFEALTARDRPYKQGMRLSEAMRIMQRFCANGHIDPDLFDVFVREKVYLRYALQFLDPWQIDPVNLES